MSIPPIQPYAMPASHELPDSVLTWRPDAGRAVLLIHDMQEYFVAPFTDRLSPKVELVDNIARLRDQADAAGVPVAYTAQPGSMSPADRGLLKDFWGPGMALSPEHREIVQPLRPVDGDWLFTKWRYSAFHRSDLAERMAASGRDQLIVCGVYAHVGVMITACDAFTRDIETFVVADAIADFTRGYHELALTWSAERSSVVATTDAVCGWLSRILSGS